MIMEITSLRAQRTDLEEENLNLKKQIRIEVQEEYKALVQALFMTCVHVKVSSIREAVSGCDRRSSCARSNDRMAFVVTRDGGNQDCSSSKLPLQRVSQQCVVIMLP